MIWFFYFAAAFGLAYIVGHSKISVWPRRLLGGWSDPIGANETVFHRPKFGWPGEWLCSLIECPACFGMWEGMVASFILPPPAHLARWAWLVTLGCTTSAVNLLLAKKAGLLE